MSATLLATALPYALSILKNKGSNIQRLLQPKFKKSNYGREMRRQTREGYLSQGQETNILNKVGTTAGNQASVVKNAYRGKLINQGMRNSVAGSRGLRESDQDVRRQVTDVAKNIYQSEESSKRDAMFQVATGVGEAVGDYKGLETQGQKRTGLKEDYKMAQEYLLKNKPEDIDEKTLDMLIKMIQDYQTSNGATV